MPIIDGLIAHYKLEEDAADTDVEDIHGTNEGTASANTSNLHVTPGKIDDAFDFDDQYYYTIPNFHTDYITVSVWVKDISASNSIIRKDPDNSNRVYAFGTWAANGEAHWNIWTTEGNTAINDVTGDVDLQDGDWHHMVATFDGTDSKIYVDGDEKATAARGGTLDNINKAIYISSRNGAGAEFIDGLADEISFWNRALDPAEILLLYNAGDGLPYPFPEGTNAQLNIGDAWKAMPGMQINIGDTWKEVEGAQVNIGDAWKEIF